MMWRVVVQLPDDVFKEKLYTKIIEAPTQDVARQVGAVIAEDLEGDLLAVHPVLAK